MKRLIVLSLTAAMLLPASAAKKQQQSHGYPINPVPFTSVKVTPGTFWGQRLEASRKVTIPLAFQKCEETGRYTNFSNAAQHLKDPSKVFKVNGVGYSFDDTDPYKTIEGASYILQTYPDKKLVQYIDSVLDVIASAQEPDGYLYTARTQNPDNPHHWAGPTRWSKVEDLSHEFYNLGHMVEGAIAHYQATGSTKFLNIARRYADCVIREVGPGENQVKRVPGHQIAEMALAKLYIVTGEQKYLDQAKFFLDMRGKTERRDEYSQAHKPVIEQDEAVGHAVRAAYMYAGMADVAALTGDQNYIKAIDAIWDNIVTKKLYITGGIGATSNGEAFGPNYYLPNMSAYCETCAAIGNVYVNHRLFLLHGESKYYDVLERTLYNGLISGVSLDGGGFFYPNPLESRGQHQRQAWFGCACCPSNICRFIPSLPGYVYAVKDRNVYVNLFLSNTGNVSVGGKAVSLRQATEYPWNGDITVTVDKNSAGQFAMKVRVPGWVRGDVVPSDLYSYSDNKRLSYSVTVNGAAVGSITTDGYYTIDRKWKKGDRVQIHFDMEPRTVRAINLVKDDEGCIAVERGPLVYCAEHPDNSFNIMNMLVNQNPTFTLADSKVLDYPVKMLTTQAQTLDFDKQGRLTTKDVQLNLIPYYAWCHRGSGQMKVWLPQDLVATRPAAQPTLANRSSLSTSHETPALMAICDGLVPKDGNDRSVSYYTWWPKQNSTEWFVYDFPEENEVKSCTVFWFDDQPWGGCSVPASWKIYFKDAAGQWQPVAGASNYGTKKGVGNTVNFNPVKTKALKLEVVLPEKLSSGIFEWSVR